MRNKLLVLLLVGICLLSGCLKPAAKKKIADPFTVVAVGMTEQEVLAMLGEPSKRSRVRGEGFDGAVQTQLRWVSKNHIITVTLVNGQVIGKNRV